MKQLLYVSHADRTLSQSELNSILSVSRWNNSRAGITGLLLHLDGGFLQVVEGEPAAVDRAFARIRVDIRHWNMRVLLEREALRSFPEWTMGFVQPSPESAESEGLFSIGRQTLADQVGPNAVPVIMTMLRAYYHIQSEAGIQLAA